MDFRTHYEEFKVQAKDLVEKVHSLVREGNIRRIIIKDEKGNTFIEIPLTVGVVTALAVPVLAGLGAIAALVANFTIGVERAEAPTKEPISKEEEAAQPAAPERQ
jgi:phage-related minor tail protein